MRKRNCATMSSKLGYNSVGQQKLDLVVFFDDPGQAKARKGKLYLVTIGVNDYDNFKEDLAYAAADASMFNSAVSKSSIANKLHLHRRYVIHRFFAKETRRLP